MTGTYNTQEPTFKFSNGVDEVCSSKINLTVTKCLSQCKDGSCSGLYSDTLGFGFQIQCLCKCHNEEEGTSN
jgi:hypothetical protein